MSHSNTDPVLATVLALPTVRALPELAELARQAATAQPRAWQLPLIVGAAHGATQHTCLPSAAAITCLQLGVILVDDLLDQDPRGVHLRLGVGAAANLATAFLAAAGEALAQGLASPERQAVAAERLARTVSRIAWGQQRDAAPLADEGAYWQIVAAKSGAFYGLAFALGALSSDASMADVQRLDAVGSRYGELIQIHDDLRDSLEMPASTDWALGRLPLPILYALTVPHAERERFAELRARLMNPDDSTPQVLSEAQAILVRSGAVSYGLDRILTRAEEARQLIRNSASPQPTLLLRLFDDIAAPVDDLLNGAGPGAP